MLAGLLPAQTTPTGESPSGPTGGYLDWVFYDELPTGEQQRISQQCPGGFIDPWSDPGLAPGQTRISADSTEGRLGEHVQYEGDVKITLNVLRLYADTALVSLPEETFALPAGGIIRQPGTAAVTEAAAAQSEPGTYQLYGARYTLHRANLHGNAEKLAQENNVFSLERTWMTRCAPGRFGWSLHARTMTIDRNTEFASGYHGTLKIGPVPVAYTPYFRFNLNRQRSSGLLRPTLAYYGQYDQWRVSTPWYWAIAPNADITTTADWMSTGDPELEPPQTVHVWNEGRYLSPYFRLDAGVGVYPGWQDDNAEQAEWGVDIQATSRNTAIDWSVDYRDTNTVDYFPEFLDDGRTAARTNTLAAGYRLNATNTRVTGRLQNQSIYDGATPAQVRGDLAYVEKPGLHIRQPVPMPWGWRLSALLDTERRRKQEPIIAELEPGQYDPLTGVRARNRLALSRTDSWQNWTLTQQYNGDHTRYTFPDYQHRTGNQHPAEGYDRWLWDTRHRLSLNIPLPASQTLTPYAQHQFRPLDEQQTELPLMNTGIDRLRDTNRLTPGVGYAWRDNELRFTSDLSQPVTLTKTLLDDKALKTDDWTNAQAGPITWSNRLAQGNLASIGTSIAWRPDRTPENEPEDFSFYGSDYSPYRLRLDYYYTPPRAALRFSSDWNLDSNPVQQVQLAGAIPLTPTFGFFGYANLERPGKVDTLALTETITGIEYDGCCWHIQLAGQRTVNEEAEESSISGTFDTIQLNFALKGLGGLGGSNSIAERMQERLPVFDNQLFDTQ